MNIAIITGASSGLGAEFVRAVVERYVELDEIWVIARRAERAVYTPGLFYKGYRFICKIVPSQLMIKISQGFI